MSAEHPKETVKRFSITWNTSNPQSLLSELVSISQETNRGIDTYYFLVRGNELIDPDTNRPVLDFIAEGVEKDVARKLQSWAIETHEGAAMWQSDKKEDIYPVPKVILSKIAYNQNGDKVVLNSAILFEAEIVNPEFKRQNLYIFPDTEENILKVIGWIEKKSKEKINLKPTTNLTISEAVYYRDQILAGVPAEYIIQEMHQKGFIGEKSISCPTSSRDISNSYYSNTTEVPQYTKYSTTETGWHNGECRICHEYTWVGGCNICQPCVDIHFS